MKFLWTKPRRAFLLLVRIKFRHSRKWTIPIPIWLLEETLLALYDVAWIWEKFIQLMWGKHEEEHVKQQWKQFISLEPVSSTLRVGSDILQDLRGYGRFRLVEVEDGEIQVYIDLF